VNRERAPRLEHLLASDDAQTGDARQVGGDTFGNTACDPVVGRLAREILEIQNRQRVGLGGGPGSCGQPGNVGKEGSRRGMAARGLARESPHQNGAQGEEVGALVDPVFSAGVLVAMTEARMVAGIVAPLLKAGVPIGPEHFDE
jgi:hypothetical protein